MGGFHVHGRQRDFLLTDDLATFYGGNSDPNDTSRVVDATSYYNRPEPYQGNRRERRAKAAQERRKKK
jgi:hypothetical protein